MENLVQNQPQGAGFYRFAIGDFKAAIISDGYTIFDDPKPLFAGDANEDEYSALLTNKFLPRKPKLLEQAAVEKTMMLSSHFSFPGMGHVAKHGQSYKWEPINWQS